MTACLSMFQHPVKHSACFSILGASGGSVFINRTSVFSNCTESCCISWPSIHQKLQACRCCLLHCLCPLQCRRTQQANHDTH
uniref:Uncharacterized protein n=1 Tax=Arundo donax TaxID=35708 RepID=A0A0A9C8C0_ARUDO